MHILIHTLTYNLSVITSFALLNYTRSIVYLYVYRKKKQALDFFDKENLYLKWCSVHKCIKRYTWKLVKFFVIGELKQRSVSDFEYPAAVD